MDPRIQYALAVIHRNDKGPWPLCRFANAAHLSPSRFRHLFKKEVGRSYRDYMRAWRMVKAKDLLIVDHLCIKQVAYRVGFSHAHNFSRAFKHQFGKTPSQIGRAAVDGDSKSWLAEE